MPKNKRLFPTRLWVVTLSLVTSFALNLANFGFSASMVPSPLPTVPGLVTYDFEGTITEVVETLGTWGWGSLGDPFWGSLSYNPAYTGPRSSFRPGFSPPEAIIVLSLSTPSKTAEVPAPSSWMVDVRASHQATGDVLSVGGEFDDRGLTISFNLEASAGTTLPENVLPVELSLSDWARAYVVMELGGPTWHLLGELTSLYQRVPPPEGASDIVAPQVVSVHVSGSEWGNLFSASLAALGFGLAAYVVPSGSDSQLASLPWKNINTPKKKIL